MAKDQRRIDKFDEKINQHFINLEISFKTYSLVIFLEFYKV